MKNRAADELFAADAKQTADDILQWMENSAVDEKQAMDAKQAADEKQAADGKYYCG